MFQQLLWLNFYHLFGADYILALDRDSGYSCGYKFAYFMLREIICDYIYFGFTFYHSWGIWKENMLQEHSY